MRKVKLYIAQSVDGKIARLNGTVDWLEEYPLPKNEDYGYEPFCKSVDTVIMGHNTYRQLLSFDIDYPYPNMENFVFTRNKAHNTDKHVQFISNHHTEFVNQLKRKEGKAIWLIGGAQINTLFYQHNLIDEIILFVIPVLIGEGIPLFDPPISDFNMKLYSSKLYSNGVVEYRYQLI